MLPAAATAAPQLNELVVIWSCTFSTQSWEVCFFYLVDFSNTLNRGLHQVVIFRDIEFFIQGFYIKILFCFRERFMEMHNAMNQSLSVYINQT